MNRIMLDLETLSTQPNAMILSIGAAKFDVDGHADADGGVVDSFYEVLDLGDQDGRHVDYKTVTWWMQQDALARSVFNEHRSPLDAGLDRFRRFCLDGVDDKREVEMWGNGSDFDNVLLGNLFDFNNAKMEDEGKVDRPWTYDKSRCFRTLKNLFPAEYRHAKIETDVRRGIPHNAEDDAVWQALVAVKILSTVQKRNSCRPALNNLLAEATDWQDALGQGDRPSLDKAITEAKDLLREWGA